MADKTASDQIDGIIAKHGGWRAETLAWARGVITKASPDIVEEVKWKTPTRPEGLPVWSCQGIVCFAEFWKDNVKLLFPKGAELKDPHNLFNARLKSKTTRAIELKEGARVDESALADLVSEAAELNKSK